MFFISGNLYTTWKSYSRKHALEIFRGALPPQRSARKDDCLSASARVSSLQRNEEVQGRKISSVRREYDFQDKVLIEGTEEHKELLDRIDLIVTFYNINLNSDNKNAAVYSRRPEGNRT